MGEAYFVDDLKEGDLSDESFQQQSTGFQTSTCIGDERYVIGGTDEDGSSIRISIFSEPTGTWSAPTVLGTKPTVCKEHTAVLLSQERILIIKSDSSDADCAWFLEVDTPYVREQKEKLDTVVVAWSKGVIGKADKPIVISGPSGVGKGTLISKLMKEFPSNFGFSVSHTTRAPREKERDGIHYHFIERSVMEKDIKDGKFLEFAAVHGNLYGTSIEAVDVVTDEGKRCILDIDVQGAKSVRASSLEAIFIFVCPPSFNELEKRLRARGTETEEQIQKRLRNAKVELEQGKEPELFDHMLVNDDLDLCYESLKKLLGLDRNADASCKSSPENFEMPTSGQMILINSGTNELEKESKKFLVDVSSLKGGAPERTRGLKMYSVNSSADGCLEAAEDLS